MSVLEAVILGIVQGLTEFLPVSSTGHLIIVQKIFERLAGEELNNVVTFDILVHLGTVAALLIIFWPEISSIIRKPFQRLTWLVILGTIPAVIIGFSFKDFFDQLTVSGKTVGVELLITGVALWYTDKIPFGSKKVNDISAGDSLFIGLMQGLAIFPAISRSGFTIVGALFRGIEKETAARYSFLLSIPAILGASLLEIKDIIGAPTAQINLLPVVVGTVMAGITGYIAIKWMLKLVTEGKLKNFAYYVWALGLVIITGQILKLW